MRENDLTPPDGLGELSNGTPAVGVFVLPDNENTGMLETLCLSSRADHPMMACVGQFLQCVENEATCQGDRTLRGPKNKLKARALAFLAAMPEDVKDCGFGAKKGYWDLDDPCLQPVIEFIQRLLAAAAD